MVPLDLREFAGLQEIDSRLTAMEKPLEYDL